MNKKLKDMTLAEVKAYCEAHMHEGHECVGCILKFECGDCAIQDPPCSWTDELLDREVEG